MTISAVINQSRAYYINKFSHEYNGEPKTSWDNILDNLIAEFESYADDEASTGSYGTLLEGFNNGDCSEIDIDNYFDTFTDFLDINNYDF